MKESNDDEPLLDCFEDIPREAFSVSAAPGDVRERTWHTTATYLYRYRIVRFAKRCTTAAALFACGVCAGVLVTQIRTGPATSSAIQSTEADLSPATELVPDAILADGEAFALKLYAASKPEQLAMLRRAGDRYLNEFGEIRLALRCYQRLLEIEGPDERQALDVNDSWLLMALKADRQLESEHDQPST